MPRHYSDFLTAYLQYSDNTEPPQSYHIWTCLSIISAALQRRVYLQWGFKALYPNMYVVLIGPSGARKGTAMGIGKELLREINGITVTSESVTREALIRDMRDAVTTFTDGTDGQLKYHSSITVQSDELSVFLGQSNVKFLADLTDWFDCQDSWTYRTKGSGTDKLVGVCVNLLGATAPDWLKSILPQEAFGGGFTSRIIFVVEEGKRQLIADPTISDEVLAMKEHLVADLEQIALMSGRMWMHEDTMRYYTEWYERQSKHPAVKDPLFAGYCERRAVHSLKLSMVCSASRSNDKIIRVEDFKRAVALLEHIESKMPRTFMGLGKARYAEMTALIYDFLKKVKTTSAADLLEKFHLDLDEYTLKIVMSTLAARQRVEVRLDPGSGNTYYRFKEKEVVKDE